MHCTARGSMHICINAAEQADIAASEQATASQMQPVCLLHRQQHACLAAAQSSVMILPAVACLVPVFKPVRSSTSHQLHALYICLPAAWSWGPSCCGYNVADRTVVFPPNAKSYSRDVLGCIFVVLTVVAGWTSLKPCRTPKLLNRQQTEILQSGRAGCKQAFLVCPQQAANVCQPLSGSHRCSIDRVQLYCRILKAAEVSCRGRLLGGRMLFIACERRLCMAG